MSDPLEGVNAIFYISLTTILCTSISLSIKYCYKSKCKSLKCGCIKIIRDVEIEKDEDLSNVNINNDEKV